MKKNMHNLVFLLCLVLFFGAFDAGIAYFGEEIWPYDSNDYEATRVAHPEEVWDRVFFGNSAVISAYREHLSESAYVNLGMDYAVVTDLWELLDEGYLKVGSELVVGLNLFALYDDLPTNPSYIWHRGQLEPYVYFHRDKLLRIAKDIPKLLMGKTISYRGKELDYGMMTDAELAEKVAEYEENYFCLPVSEYQENIEALDKIADWCEDHGVRMRVLWMPFNPDVERPELLLDLMQIVNEWCAQRGIPVGDYSYQFERSCFLDVGHLNDEVGAARFTEVIDPWLLG
jgi:hypothetical protein